MESRILSRFFDFIIILLIWFMFSTRGELLPCVLPWRLPCPIPPWSPTYNMQYSTQNYIGANSGAFNNETINFAALHGVIGIDGYNYDGHPSHWEETLVKLARMIKSVNPKTRVFVYRQSELALNIFDTNSKVMYDPSKKNWFVLYPNGTIYNDSTTFKGIRMDQFCWDHRNSEVQDYFVNYYIGSVFDQPSIDGIFYDDDVGIWQERSNYPDYPNEYRQSIDAAQQVSLNRAWELGLRHGKHAWQSWLDPDIPTSSDTPVKCADKMRIAITMKDVPVTFPSMYNGGCYHPWEECKDLKQQLSAFLIARGDYWLFFGPTTWWKEGFEVDYGIPLSDSYEPFDKVFVREWSNAIIILDCNNFTSEIIFDSSINLIDKQNIKSDWFAFFSWWIFLWL